VSRFYKIIFALAFLTATFVASLREQPVASAMTNEVVAVAGSEKFWAGHPEWREQTASGQDAQLDWRKLMNLTDPECAATAAAVPAFGDRHEQARAFLNRLQIPVCPVMLGNRAVFGDSGAVGLAAQLGAPLGGSLPPDADPVEARVDLERLIAERSTAHHASAAAGIH